MGPVGGLWLSRGDSDTGTLGEWGVHSEKPPHLLSGISAPQSQPCWAVLLSFCVPPRAFAQAAPHVLQVCSQLPPPIWPSLPVTAPLSPVTVSPSHCGLGVTLPLCTRLRGTEWGWE